MNEVTDEVWRALLERDQYKCLNCNSEENLAPAHYESRRYRNNSLENLMLLCFECHRKTHDGKLKIKCINGHFYFKEID